jgi:uncharacterized protein
MTELGGPAWWITDGDPVFDAFWQGCKDQRLLARRCSACQSWAPYLAHLCPGCGSARLDWAAVSGAGVLYSFTHVMHAPRPELADAVPYTLIMVDLAEGPRLAARLWPAAPDRGDLVGRAVFVDFREIDGGTYTFVFRLTDPDGAES